MSGSQKQPGVILQDRDIALLRGLYESRIMTRQHIAVLFFDGKTDAAKKRIQKLIRSKFMTERPRKPYESAILYLAKAGYDALDKAGVLSEYPAQSWKSFRKRVLVSDRTINHELAVMDVKAGLTEAIREQSHLQLVEFSTWPKLYEFRARKPVTSKGITRQQEILMKPDGFLRIHEQDDEGLAEHVFFLEVDQGTETLRQLVSKAIGYRDYYRRGGFAERCGYDPKNPAACPFRVLVVVQSEARRQNLIRCLLDLRPPINAQIVVCCKKQKDLILHKMTLSC
jgi:hypothetical protein